MVSRKRKRKNYRKPSIDEIKKHVYLPIKEHVGKYCDKISKKFRRRCLEKKAYFALVVIAAICISIIFYVAFGIPEKYVLPPPQTKVKTISIKVYGKLSMEEYIKNINEFSGKKINVTGYLRCKIQKGLGSGYLGIHKYSVVDDFENEINFSEVNQNQRYLFVVNGTTDKIYNVVGNIRTFYDGFELLVSEITPGERPEMTIQKNIEVDNCSEGKRLYNGQCIPIISCNDGSLDPECSQDKPYQCIGGALISRASVCGCDPGDIAQGDKCVSSA
jgi:hypothetical protein